MYSASTEPVDSARPKDSWLAVKTLAVAIGAARALTVRSHACRVPLAGERIFPSCESKAQPHGVLPPSPVRSAP